MTNNNSVNLFFAGERADEKGAHHAEDGPGQEHAHRHRAGLRQGESL